MYVDFLFCGKLNDGIDIKNNLYNQLSLSSQLLFLRSVNSELNIREVQILEDGALGN